MKYSPSEVLEYVAEEDIKFIRLAFCDVFGKQKNVAIMASELPQAFAHGIAIDASAISGFGGEIRSDLFLHPDASTLVQLPWRPQQGKVVRMFCDVTYPDGTPFECDTRQILKEAIACAREAGYHFDFGSEMEFYLFQLDEKGCPTKEPYDNASYMDIAPEDKGENIRREICLMLEQMDIAPESSHHESGPGQNEIDFRYSDPLTAADQAVTFHTVVKTVAYRNGLAADFSPKPLPGKDGNGMHINISVSGGQAEETLGHVIAGIMDKIRDITLFLNPTAGSYARLGCDKAPGYISWSRENRSQLIRIPATPSGRIRAELHSPDPQANPYLAYALLIYAGLQGIARKLPLLEPADFNLLTASPQALEGYGKLPVSLTEAMEVARESDFLRRYLPQKVMDAYCQRR